MNLKDLYAESFANWLSGGNLVTRDKISLLGIKPLYDRYLTNKYITKVWCLTRFPVYCNSNITQAIRSEMFKLCPEVKTVILTYSLPAAVNPTSDVYNRQLKKSAAAYNKYNEIFDSLSDDQKLTGTVEYDKNGKKNYVNADILNAIKELYDSYTYVYKQATTGGQFFETYYFVQASAKSKSSIKKYRKNLTTLLDACDIKFIECRGNISSYLSNFCPASFKQQDSRKITSMLFSQENLAALMPTKTKGLVGEKGILMGLDWQVKLPFMLDFFGSGAAQVIMVLAKSGWGKTVSMFMTALELIAANTHCSVIDIKGNEWIKLLKYVKGCIISMEGNQARFVNTLRLDDLNCTRLDCEETFNMAVRDTVTLYSLMVNLQSNEGNEQDLEMILEQAVMKMYFARDVIKTNPDTFVRTRNMTLGEVIDIVDGLAATASYSENQRKLCSLIRTRLSSFFLVDGRYSEAFKNEVSVGEIINTPLTIYSFNKNAGTMLDNLDTIRVFMVQALDNRKTAIRKRQSLHTASFYEELQRSAQFGRLVDAISHRVTGSRSDNVTIFLLLNAISTFDNDAFNAIKSNITTVMAGKLDPEDINRLVENFGCYSIKNYLQEINSEDNERYRNCFAIQYDIGYKTDKALIKTIVPPDMSKQLSTRDVIIDET